MKALITGTGQDASYLTELLLDKKYDVVVVYRRSSLPKFDRFADIKSNRVKFVCGDVSDYSSVYSVLSQEKPDEIYNLAAMSFVGASFDQPRLTMDVNCDGCLNFLEAMRHLYSEDYRPKFYQASTSEMFGSMVTYHTYNSVSAMEADIFDRDALSKNFKRHDLDWNDLTKIEKLYSLFQDENTPMKPCSPYGVAKLAAHHFCNIYRKSYGMYVTSSVLYNHESPRRGEEFVTRKITKYFAGLYNAMQQVTCTGEFKPSSEDRVVIGLDRKENPMEVPKLKLGNLDACRDWSHAKDMVRGMWMIMQADKPDDFVLASGETHSVQDFLEHVVNQALNASGRQNFDTNSVIEKYVMQDKSLFRPCEVPVLRGNAKKAKRVLGWEPEISFDGLVEDMLVSDINSGYNLLDEKEKKQT